LLSFPEVAIVATLEKISLNLDNLCLAYLRLLTVATQVAALVLALSLRKSFLCRWYGFYRLCLVK